MKQFVMTWFVRNRQRLIFRWRRAQLHRELAEELEFHRALKERENEQAGLSPGAARELSRKQMGNITLAQEESRDAWSFMRLEQFLQDLRYAMRMFGKTPMFTGIALFSLALGIGGNAAMFSLVNSLLLRPLPYREPDRLLRITGIYPRAAMPAFQQGSRSMDVAALSTGKEFNLTGQGEAARILASNASANFLAVLGASPMRGRTFEQGEDLPGRDGVVILSYSLWKNKFSGSNAILGRVIRLNDVNREVVGIMPPDFNFPSTRVQAWVPMRLDPANFLEYWGGEFVPLIARIRAGGSVEAVRGDIQPIIAQFRKTFPYPMARDWNADATAIPLQQDLVGDVRGKLMILLCSVAAILLIACANVASLLLSRATMRRKEIALRAALGAGRLRIIRQLLTESILLGLVGGVLGILLGAGILSIFKSLLPSSMPGVAQAAIDWHVGAAVTALSLLTGLAFGIAPALSASQIDLTEAIKTGSQRSTTGIWTRLRSQLITGEVALSLVLVASAGLLIKSLYSLSEINPGFQPAHILTIRISPNQSSCAQRLPCISLYQGLLERISHIPGITESSIANNVPLDGELPTLAVDVEGHPKSADHPAPMLWSGAISPGYIRMMHIPLLAGRELTPGDAYESGGVLLISTSTAKRFWPGENPIGKHIKPAGEKQWRTVVGVVGDVRQYTLNKGLPAWVAGAVYMPYSQSVLQDGQIPAAMTLLVKASSDAARIESEVRKAAEDQNPNIPISQIQPLNKIVSGSIAEFRSTIRVFISFAAAAILLAAIGIYGLASYWVTQRTYEIGLRVAIGATRRQILTMILGQSLRVVVYGIGIGVITALVLTRFLGSLLYRVSAADPIIFGSVTILLLGVAIGATAFPAWKAARIDPVTSLRTD